MKSKISGCLVWILVSPIFIAIAIVFPFVWLLDKIIGPKPVELEIEEESDKQ